MVPLEAEPKSSGGMCPLAVGFSAQLFTPWRKLQNLPAFLSLKGMRKSSCLAISFCILYRRA